MKNSKLRTLLFSLLFIASIGSYVYINSVEVSDCKMKFQAKQQLLQDEDDSQNAELPDVKLFKKLVEKGKQLIPSTQL